MGSDAARYRADFRYSNRRACAPFCHLSLYVYRACFHSSTAHRVLCLLSGKTRLCSYRRSTSPEKGKKTGNHQSSRAAALLPVYQAGNIPKLKPWLVGRPLLAAFCVCATCTPPSSKSWEKWSPEDPGFFLSEHLDRARGASLASDSSNLSLLFMLPSA